MLRRNNRWRRCMLNFKKQEIRAKHSYFNTKTGLERSVDKSVSADYNVNSLCYSPLLIYVQTNNRREFRKTSS